VQNPTLLDDSFLVDCQQLTVQDDNQTLSIEFEFTPDEDYSQLWFILQPADNINVFVGYQNGINQTLWDNFSLKCESGQLIDFGASNPNLDPCSFQFITEELMPSNASIVSYLWDFGDGTSNAQEIYLANPTHTYATDGQYHVTLNIVDSNGCCKEIGKTVSCIDTNTPCGNLCQSPLQVVLDYQPLPGAPEVNDQCTYIMNAFIGQPDPPVFPAITVISYLWDFGDGTISTDASPVHIFNAYGTYYGSLTITDSNGCCITIPQQFICSRCVNYVCYEDYYSFGECVGGVLILDPVNPSGPPIPFNFGQSIPELNIQDIADATELVLAQYNMVVELQDPTGTIGCTKNDLDPSVYGIPDIALYGFFFYGDVQVVGFTRNEDCNPLGTPTPLYKEVPTYYYVYNIETGEYDPFVDFYVSVLVPPNEYPEPFNTCS